jgi:type I restriction enzyme R subunit
LLTTAEVIDEVINIGRTVRAADKRGEDMGLTDDELAFYDALETNDSAVAVLGDEQLRKIAREIADKVRRNATIDWTVKETVRAKIMVIVRRVLNKYGYPPDKQNAAMELVMAQAKNLAETWATL